MEETNRPKVTVDRQAPGAITKKEAGPQSQETLIAEFQILAEEFGSGLRRVQNEVQANANEFVLVSMINEFVIEWKRKFKDPKWQRVDSIRTSLGEIITTLSTLNEDWVRGELRRRAQQLSQLRLS